ncbi:LacI family DNA-binding transcriptional regulator [Planctomyces sp. SH-PL62]|uniref:LacI family DNA-binding transcriptional regulator n=1 Tax=Planctomyces sp. SH-PL62 TaxID=1636152 RepID=UPI00078C50CE|nr:LacI family DNA-binding transcriptional regulator [Planctomyces sp. SH-PL62]AMV38436.1 HTH-type transcriptional regulator GntR [Planctomyces sp. SH-PL62]
MAKRGGGTTIRDVAGRAGVSLITVSRALRRPEAVSESLRARIREAADDLGYIPNRAASGLASGASRVVPVILSSLADPLSVGFLDGVREELAGAGFQILLGTTGHRVDVEDELVAAFLGWVPAGLVLAGVDHSAGVRRKLRRAGTPVVEALDLADEPRGLNVGVSHRAVGEAASGFLADRGRSRIAYAGALTEMGREADRRIEGFRAGLRERGLPDHLIVRGDDPPSLAAGARLLAQALRRFPEIDAVFLDDADLAAGAVAECRNRGVAVPGSLALMGLHDREIASAAVPAITSIAIPGREMGRAAARMLLDALEEVGPPAPRRVDMGFRIIERESTGPKGGPT